MNQYFNFIYKTYQTITVKKHSLLINNMYIFAQQIYTMIL